MDYGIEDIPEVDWKDRNVIAEVKKLMKEMDLSLTSAQIAYASILQNRELGVPHATPLILLFPESPRDRIEFPEYFTEE